MLGSAVWQESKSLFLTVWQLFSISTFSSTFIGQVNSTDTHENFWNVFTRDRWITLSLSDSRHRGLSFRTGAKSVHVRLLRDLTVLSNHTDVCCWPKEAHTTTHTYTHTHTPPLGKEESGLENEKIIIITRVICSWNRQLIERAFALVRTIARN